jgi:predicted TIM-barrel fold metal-dependent hydrolase
MILGHPVIDADSHKCENPAVFFDYIPQPYRKRFSLLRDRYGEQRFRILDRDPRTGRTDFPRVFLQPEGYGKGTFRPYHEETTLGGLFNRVRLEHMDREGIDHQVVYGSMTLAFQSLIDSDLAVALCRSYNDYITDDSAAWAHRVHPVGVIPLQDPGEALREMRRCVDQLGMPAVSIGPNVPLPHPEAPDRFPAIRVPKPLSHPDFFPLFAEAERLDVAIGIHGAPGVQLAGGCSDQLDSFTLVHAFANRCMQQMAIARLIFDGVLERFPRLRFGFLEAGASWFPDLIHNLHEQWEKRILRFDPSIEPSLADFLVELARERDARGRLGLLRKARRLLGVLRAGPEDKASPQELEKFRHEHPRLVRDPLDYARRGQIFLTCEPDDPAPGWLPAALGEWGERLCGMAVDYGHWDAQLRDCVGLATRAAGTPERAVRLLSTNALEFYGERLRRRLATGCGSRPKENHERAVQACPSAP